MEAGVSTLVPIVVRRKCVQKPSQGGMLVFKSIIMRSFRYSSSKSLICHGNMLNMVERPFLTEPTRIADVCKTLLSTLLNDVLRY